MKNKLFIFIALAMSFSFGSVAQSEYNYYYDYQVQNGYHLFYYNSLIYNPSKNVKQVTFSLIGNKGIPDVYVKKFDAKGRITEQLANYKGKGLKPSFVYGYNDTSKYFNKQETYYTSGKLKSIVNIDRNSKNLLLLNKTTNSKGKITYQNTWTYNEKGLLVGSSNYKKGGVEIKKTWKYEYNNDDKKTRSALYNKKGKLIHEWTFDCNEKGTQLAKIKDQTQVCIWDENEGKYLTKVYQTFNENGKIRKYVTKFSLPDTLIIEHSTYNEKDELISKSTYDKDYKKPLVYESYNKGKLIYKQAFEYSGNLLVKMEIYHSDKLYKRQEFSYNEENLLFENKQFNKKNKLTLTTKLEYEL